MHDRLRAASAQAQKYRADIDGLRAVAVLSVVGYHYFPTTVPGGLVGVDIFFVISGFLITGLVMDEAAAGRFSLLDFYSRRIRRIFPALALVLAACLAAGWFLLASGEYARLGEHTAAAAIFVQNLLLHDEIGYFDVDAGLKPLLHLWSLSIEEQFYLVWPVFILALRGRGFVILAVGIGGVTAASFAANVLLGAEAFYLPHARAWELSLGALIALWLRRNPVTLSQRTATVCSIAGFALMGGALFLMRDHTGFPGWWALPPTAGAAMLILAGSTPSFRSPLANRWAVRIGLISYPLYLWHWPLYSFPYIVLTQEPDRIYRVLAVVMSIALATLTYWLLERPIRAAPMRRPVVALLLASMIALGGFGFVAYNARGWPDLARPGEAYDGETTHEEFFQYIDRTSFPCANTALAREAIPFSGGYRCHQSKPDTPPTVALIGDSHAEHLYPGLAEALPEKNVVYFIKAAFPRTSSPLFAHIYEDVVADPNIKTVILSVWWRWRVWSEPEVTVADLGKELTSIAEKLTGAGKVLYIVDDVPDFTFLMRRCMKDLGLVERRCSEPSAGFHSTYDRTMTVIEAVAAAMPNTHIIRTAPYLCDETDCRMTADGELLYRDKNHLSVRGSRYVGQRIVWAHPELRGEPL